jgi:type III pantothenate kinase
VGPDATGGLRLDVSTPESLGPDRIASAAAAFELFGAPVAVVDFGTATTVDFIKEEGVFSGGVIIPGVGLMLKSLSGETARLPQAGVRRPESALGKDTEGCLLSGVVYGTAGAVERVIEEVEREEGLSYGVAVTGGYLDCIRPYLRRADYVEPDLTLKGLRMIYRRTADA